MLLVTFALSRIAAVLGLLGTGLEVVQQLSAIPVFLGNALVPADAMPAWPRAAAAKQPLGQAADCIRALLAGRPLGPGRHAAAEPARTSAGRVVGSAT